MAAACASVGFWPAAFGAAVAAAGFAGAGADGAGAVVVVSVFGGEATGSMAFTACLQAPESFDMFFCKHCNEAAPPGGTLAQLAS